MNLPNTAEEIIQQFEEKSGSDLPTVPGKSNEIFSYLPDKPADTDPELEPGVVKEENSETLLQLVETLASTVVNLQREVDLLQDSIARAFKEIGHGDTWAKIIHQ